MLPLIKKTNAWIFRERQVRLFESKFFLETSKKYYFKDTFWKTSHNLANNKEPRSRNLWESNIPEMELSQGNFPHQSTYQQCWKFWDFHSDSFTGRINRNQRWRNSEGLHHATLLLRDSPASWSSNPDFTQHHIAPHPFPHLPSLPL